MKNFLSVDERQNLRTQHRQERDIPIQTEELSLRARKRARAHFFINYSGKGTGTLTSRKAISSVCVY